MAWVADRRLGSILRNGRSAPSGRQPENRSPAMLVRLLGLAGPGPGSTVLVRRHCRWRRARSEKGRWDDADRGRDCKATLDEEFLRGFSIRWHAAWNSHDHHQVAALCTGYVEWHDPSLPGPGRGADVIAGLMETLVRACPDFRFEETEPAYHRWPGPRRSPRGGSPAQ